MANMTAIIFNIVITVKSLRPVTVYHITTSYKNTSIPVTISNQGYIKHLYIHTRCTYCNAVQTK